MLHAEVKGMTIYKLTCCVAVAVAGVGGQAVAAVINVPGDQPTIQAGIDAAVNGDEVVVAPGTYFETINFLGKAITLRSSGGPAVTTIDGTGNLHVAQCVSGEGPDTVLSGFVITGGNANDELAFPNNSGGGMLNLGTSPTVTNCTFSGNSAFSNGGGMFNQVSSPTVTNCTFSGNIVNFSGGGMYNITGSSPTVTNCTFNGNTAKHGGGMYNFSSNPTVTNCTFNGNTAGSTGGGMDNKAFSSPTVTNCTFTANSALGTGGGGMFILLSSPTVTNCTFSGNTASQGGGMYKFGGSGSPTVTNCVLWSNSPDEIIGAATVNYSDVEGGFAGVGNIDADPLFVDPANGDYRLPSGSPSIDAGNNWGTVDITDTDLDGNPRFADDPATVDTGCGVPVIVDMGAFEFQGTPATVKLGDIDGDGAVALPDLLTLLAAWGPAGGGCQLADFDLDGIVGVPDLLILLANWTV